MTSVMRWVAVLLVAVVGITVAAPGAEAHSGQGRAIEVVRVKDSVRSDHSIVKVRFRPSLQGKPVRVFVEHKLLWGCAKSTPHCKGYRGLAMKDLRVVLPKGRTRTSISIPVDVATRPGTRHPDAIRVTNVNVVFRNRFAQAGDASVRSVNRGDPGNWSPAGARPVWVSGARGDHYHLVTIRR